MMKNIGEKPHLRNRFKSFKARKIAFAAVGILTFPSITFAATAIDPQHIQDSTQAIAPGNGLVKKSQQQLLVEPQLKTGSLQPSEAAVSGRADLSMNAGFTVDPFTGSARLNLPIKASKGPGSFLPSFALSYNGSKAAEGISAWSVAGAETIGNCFAREGLCLGDTPLLPVKGSKTGSLYRLAGDPLSLLRQTESGYALTQSSGEKYEFVAASKKASIWRLQKKTDPYGNFVDYGYLGDSNWPSVISYGQKNASPSQLQTIEFTYSTQKPTKLLTISSKAGNDTVRNYQLSYDKFGNPITYSECAPDEATKVSCNTLYQFDWITFNSSTPVLHTATNALGGVIDISYTDNKSGAAVSSFNSKSGKVIAEEIQYIYGTEILGKNGKRIGYQQVAAYNPAKDAVTAVIYGTGDLMGHVLSVVNGHLGNKAFSLEAIKPATQIKNDFKKITTSVGDIFVLSKKTQFAQTIDNDFEVLAETSFDYDSLGRLSKIADKDTETVFTFQKSDIYPSLVASEKTINLTDKSTISESVWSYTFKDSYLAKIDITETEADDPSSTAKGSFTFDAFGNVVSSVIGGRTTNVTYDNVFMAFPTEIVRTSEDGTKDWSKVAYDTASGEITRLENNLGNIINVTLDKFGIPTKTTMTTELPKDKDSPGVLVQTSERNESQTEDGQVLLTDNRSIRLGNQKDAHSSLTQKTYLDGLGRITKLEATTQSADSKATTTSTVTKQYLKGSVISKMTLPDGSWSERETDYLNRLLREKDQIRGEVKYEYDTFNQVSAVIRNGQKLSFKYDDQGRLVERALPDGKKYTYQYDELFLDRPTQVTLPDGEVIKYEYYTDGSRKSKAVVLKGADNKSYEFKTSFTYKNDQLSSITYPDGSKIAYNYDGPILEDIRWTTKPPANWDDIEKPLAKYQGTSDNDNNLILTRTLHNGVTERRQWDTYARLSHVTVSNKKGGTLLDLDYSHDEKTGMIEKVQRTQGEQLLTKEFTYNTQGYLNDIHRSLDGKNEKSSFGYNDAGSLIKDENGLRNYNLEDGSAYRLASRSDGLTIKYDANGNVIEKKRGQNVSSFTFDALNLLQQANVTSNGKNYVSSMSYDETGQRLIKKVKTDDGETTTAYVDRLYEVTWRADGTVQQTKYVPDPLAIIAAYTETLSAKDLLEFIPAVTQSLGNPGDKNIVPGEPSLLQKAIAETSLWVQQNLSGQARATLAPALIAAMVLALIMLFEMAMRRQRNKDDTDLIVGRLANTLPGRTTFMVNHRVMAALSPVIIASFLMQTLIPTAHAVTLDGDGMPQPNKAVYFHEGNVGSTLLVTDGTGAQTSSIDYGVYGEIQNNSFTSGKDVFRPKYARMEYDQSLALYYDHARYYDPDIGRFISVDPAAEGRDPYIYSSPNPVNFFDPDGRKPMLDSDLVVESGIPARSNDPTQSLLNTNRDQEIIDTPNSVPRSDLPAYRQLLYDHATATDSELTDLDAPYEVDEEDVSNYTVVPPSFWWLFWSFKKKVVDVGSQIMSIGQAAPSNDEANQESELAVRHQNLIPVDENEQQEYLNIESDTDSDDNKENQIDEVKDENEDSLEDIPLDLNSLLLPRKDVYFDEDKILYSLLKRIRHSNTTATNTYNIDPGILNLVQSDPYLSIVDDETRHNSLATRNMKGLSSTGAFLISLLAFIPMALVRPSYSLYEDEVDVSNNPPVYIEMIVNLLTIIGFSGLSKLFYFNQANYWNENILKKAKETDQDVGWKDYLKLAARRMSFGVLFQVVTFTTFGIAGHLLRGFTMYTGVELARSVLTNFMMSVLGNLAWMPFYISLRSGLNEYLQAQKIEKARELNLKNTTYESYSWVYRYMFKYRRFLGGKEGWVNSKWWTPLKILSYYFVYHIGNIGYYGGFSSIMLMNVGSKLNFAYVLYMYERNMFRIFLSPSDNFYGYITRIPGWAKSLTITQEKSKENPRTNFLKYIIGPTNGVRIFRYDDTSYLPPALWRPKMKSFEVERLKQILRDYDFTAPTALQNQNIEVESENSNSNDENADEQSVH